MLDLGPTSARIVLPPPISTNNLYKNVGAAQQAAMVQRGQKRRSRVPTAEYTAWRRTADQFLMCQHPLPKFVGPVDITLLVGEEGVGNMDSGNTEKAPIDLLVANKVIVDDSKKWVRSIRPRWCRGLRGMVAVIEPAGDEPNGAAIAAMIPVNLRELLR